MTDFSCPFIDETQAILEELLERLAPFLESDEEYIKLLDTARDTIDGLEEVRSINYELRCSATGFEEELEEKEKTIETLKWDLQIREYDYSDLSCRVKDLEDQVHYLQDEIDSYREGELQDVRFPN